MSNWEEGEELYRIRSGATGDDYHGTEVLVRDIPKSIIEAVALHYYAVIDWYEIEPSVDYDEGTYFKSIRKALKMEEYVAKHIATMDKI